MTDTLQLRYTLNELPSSQHRAGLAGLLLMLQWLEKRPKRTGIARCVDLTPYSLTVELDKPGLAELLNAAYDATLVEQPYPKPFKKKGELVPPLREETVTIESRNGKSKEVKQYFYPVVIPTGAFLGELDSSADKLWLKLWRDFVWSIMRGVPATRRPFEDRAGQREPSDIAATWKLQTSKPKAVELPSTFYLGAQAKSAEDVPFKDRSRFFFLLNFWPYACQLFVPRSVGSDGKAQYLGYVVCVPDISNMEIFPDAFVGSQSARDGVGTGYRPREAIVDLVEQSGLESLYQLRAHTRAKSEAVEAVSAIDVFHVDKRGNNVRVLYTARVDPDELVLREYERCRRAYWHSTFRKQRLRNALDKRPWHDGFGPLCSTLPADVILGGYFKRDVHEAFTKTETCQVTSEESPDSIEKRIYRIVGSYLGQQLDQKHDIRWAESESDEQKQQYSDKKRDIARKAFLAARSRTGADFVEYFVSTLCSVPQRLSEESYLELATSLHQQTELVRTLTLLALSARA